MNTDSAALGRDSRVAVAEADAERLKWVLVGAIAVQTVVILGALLTLVPVDPH